VVFGLAFVAAVVTARIGQVDPSLEEASQDLGATAWSTFFRITVPTLLPAIVAGALLVFTLSLDEFVIAFFTDGPSTPTLPIVIYSMVRFGVTPEINALAAILLLVSFTVVIAAQRMTRTTDVT
jgi:spermidine/putrescine transport system permease protein